MNVDQDLVIRGIQGDKEAISSLIETYYERILYTTIQKFGVDGGTEVAHKVVVEIIQSIKNLKQPERFEVWMMQLLRFVCLNEIKLKYRDLKMFTEFENGDPDTYYVEHDDMEFIPEEYIVNVEKRQLVLEVIHTLPQNYQDVLMDFFFHQMSYEEMAEIHNITKMKVRNDLYRGKMLLKKRLEAVTGREFTYSVGIGTIPLLSQLFLADSAAVLTPSMYTSFFSVIGKALSKLGGTGGGIGGAVGTGGITIKAVAVGVITIGLVGGAILSVKHNNTTPSSLIAPPVEVTTQVEIVSTEESTFTIRTLEDMIGVDEAKRLRRFKSETASEKEWIEFIEHIGAEVEVVSAEYDKEYVMYLLQKKDKQLVLVKEQEKGGHQLRVIYKFGDIEELPRMIKIILQFDSA